MIGVKGLNAPTRLTSTQLNLRKRMPSFHQMANRWHSIQLLPRSKHLVESNGNRMAKGALALKSGQASIFEGFDCLSKSSEQSHNLHIVPFDAVVTTARVEFDPLYQKLKKTMELNTYEKYKNMDMKLLMKKKKYYAATISQKFAFALSFFFNYHCNQRSDMCTHIF